MRYKVLFLSLFLSVCLHLFIFIPWPFSNHSQDHNSIVINVISKEAAGERNNKKLTAKQTSSPALQAVRDGAPEPASVLGTDLGIEVVYPRLSRELGETGQVLVEISKSEPRLYSSSGFSRLDEAAISAIRQAITSGLLKQTELKVTFIFKLTGN